MKFIFSTIILTLLLVSCASSKYKIPSENGNDQFLIDFIKKSERKLNKPLIVIDGQPFRHNVELKNAKLPITESQIQKIDILEYQTGINIYGNPARGGVLLITKKKESIENKSFYESRVLIMLDDKIISRDEMKKLNPENIKSIEVIKNKVDIKKYTSENVDGVITIKMEKE